MGGLEKENCLFSDQGRIFTGKGVGEKSDKFPILLTRLAGLHAEKHKVSEEGTSSELRKREDRQDYVFLRYALTSGSYSRYLTTKTY